MHVYIILVAASTILLTHSYYSDVESKPAQICLEKYHLNRRRQGGMLRKKKKLIVFLFGFIASSPFLFSFATQNTKLFQYLFCLPLKRYQICMMTEKMWGKRRGGSLRLLYVCLLFDQNCLSCLHAEEAARNKKTIWKSRKKLNVFVACFYFNVMKIKEISEDGRIIFSKKQICCHVTSPWNEETKQKENVRFGRISFK